MKRRTVKYEHLIRVDGNWVAVSKPYPNRENVAEIVYLLHGIKPTYEDARFVDGEWHFLSDGQVGADAIDVPRLRKYLEMLPGFHPPKRSAAPKKGPNRQSALKKQRPRPLRSRR